MLMMLVNVSLQIPRGISVNGEIMHTHTIHESNYAAIKLPRNGNSKANKLNNKTIKTVQFIEVIKHS